MGLDLYLTTKDDTELDSETCWRTIANAFEFHNYLDQKKCKLMSFVSWEEGRDKYYDASKLLVAAELATKLCDDAIQDNIEYADAIKGEMSELITSLLICKEKGLKVSLSIA